MTRLTAPRGDRPAPGATADTPAPARQDATTLEATPGGGQRRGPRVGALPARIAFGVPGLVTATTTGRQARPDLADDRRAAPAASGRAMTPARGAVAEQRVDRALADLHPVPVSEAPPTTPASIRGMETEAGFREALQGMFGDAGPRVAERLLAAVPAAQGSPAPFAAPLVLATALHGVAGPAADRATALVEATRRGEASPEAFRLQRLLAATSTGTEALGHLHGLNGQADRLEAVRDQLAICSALEEQGVRMDMHGSAAHVLRTLEASPESRMAHRVGEADDAPLQLLSKALRHASAAVAGSAATPAGATDRAAFVAWKKGGFVTSGRGTDFDRTIGRMHKFLAYVDRAEHGPRTIRNLLRDARALVGRTFGVGKSPLTPMRHGTLGGDLGLLSEERARHRQLLGQAIGTAVESLMEDLRDPRVQQRTEQRHQALARAAVLDLWHETDRAQLPLEDVMRRASRLAEDAGAGAVHAPTLERHLRAFTRATRTGSGAPALAVGLPALEAVGQARARRTAGPGEVPYDPDAVRGEIRQLRAQPRPSRADRARLAELQARRSEFVTGLVAQVREIEQPRQGAKVPLFRLSDLKSLFRGEARPGPGADHAREVMQSLAHAKYESTSVYADGASHGLGAFGALPLHTASLMGLPFVYPVARAETGKKAAVSIGISSTGGRLFVGTERATSASVGAGAGWAFPPVAGQRLNAALVAEATVSHGQSHGEGAVILARSDVPGWREKLPEVVDFLFEEARRAPDADLPRATHPAETWQRFAEKFGDDPQVVVGWTHDRSAGTSAQVGATAVARVAVDGRTAIGPGATVAVRAEAGRSRRSANADGTDIPNASHARRVVVGASLGLSETVPLVPSAPHGGAVIGWTSAVPQLGVSAEWDVAGGIGAARLGRTADGRLSPGQCHREVIFQTPERLVEFVNLHRARWEEAMVAQDPSRATTPQAARERLNTFLDQLVAAPRQGDRIHGQQMSLDPAVAERINRMEARMRTMLGEGDAASRERPLSPAEHAEVQALQAEASRLLRDDRHWVPSFIYAGEINQAGRTTGLNFGVRAVNQESAQAVRATVLTVPGAPEVR